MKLNSSYCAGSQKFQKPEEDFSVYYTILLRDKTRREILLKNVKKMLMSRNMELQVEAVYFITQSLEASKRNSCQEQIISDILLDADVTEFLCEAMATVDCQLLGAIFLCLEYLTVNKKFYNNSHALYVVECLIRAAYFLMKQNNSFHTLNEALTLLATLLKGLVSLTDSKALRVGALNVNQLLEMIQSVVVDTKCSTDSKTVLFVSWVLSNLMENKNLENQLDMTSLKLMVTVLNKCITLLSSFVMNNEEMHSETNRKEAVLLLSCISLSCTRFCSKISHSKMFRNRPDKNAKITSVTATCIEKIMGMVLKCIQFVSAPYILKTEIETSNMELFCKFFSCLRAIYCEPVEKLDTSHLSHYLGELGFLTLLPVISSWSRRFRDGIFLHSICISILGELLSSMSISVLNIEDQWPGGTASFQKHLYTGLQYLPFDRIPWLQVLAEESPLSSQHAVLVYTFFLCLCSPSPYIGGSCLPVLVSYLSTLPSVTLLPVPIIKALWFVYAMASLSYRGPVHTERSTSILSWLLEQQTQLRNVYIHHPTLLYWTFSSHAISPSIQKEVMTLWLEGDESDSKDLSELVMTNNDASFCILEVIQCSKSQIVKRAINILHDAILHQCSKGNDELIQTLWDILPQIWTQFHTTNSSVQAANVGSLMQLACIAVPHNLSSATVIRGAFLLTRMLVNQADSSTDISLLFYNAAIHQAFLLLLVSMQLQDKRALAIYLSEPKFLRVLHTALESKDKATRSIALHFLSHLLHYQIKFQLTECDHFVEVDCKQILHLLTSSDSDILAASLQLTFNLLQSRLDLPVIILSENKQHISSEFLLTLFVKLQVLSVKNFPGISGYSWRCLGALLHFSSTHFVKCNIQMHLVLQPWTYFLIRVTTRRTSISGFHDFLYFICQWLQCYQSFSSCRNARLVFKKERALCPSLFSETLTEVATMLKYTDLSNLASSTKCLAAQVIHEILENESDLSEETCKLLRHLQGKHTLLSQQHAERSKKERELQKFKKDKIVEDLERIIL